MRATSEGIACGSYRTRLEGFPGGVWAVSVKARGARGQEPPRPFLYSKTQHCVGTTPRFAQHLLSQQSMQCRNSSSGGGGSSSAVVQHPRQQARRSGNSGSWPAAALVLLACCALLCAPAAQGAVKYEGTDEEGNSLMTPIKGEVLGRTYYYEIPQDPVGVLVMFHGCVHDASDFWGPSKECPECQGLPEEISHTKQALARGYAVLAIDSINRDPGNRCYSWGPDKWGVKYILESWTRSENLQSLPIFAMGVSAGASFALKLPKITRINGIVSEVLGIPEDGFSAPTFLEETYPPVIFVDMHRDTRMSARIASSSKVLLGFGVPAEIIQVEPRPVPPDFFFERSEFISQELSRKIVAALRKINMINAQGYLTQDPRYTTQPWREQLASMVPELSPKADAGGAAGVEEDGSAVSEQMNLAFAWHEIVSDSFTACLAWLEAQGSVPIATLVRELQLKQRLRDLQPQRLADPPLQDDDALKEAAKQVDEQLATTGVGVDENWGLMYAAYVDWLKTNPTGDLTFPAWRNSRAAGKFRVGVAQVDPEDETEVDEESLDTGIPYPAGTTTPADDATEAKVEAEQKAQAQALGVQGHTAL